MWCDDWCWDTLLYPFGFYSEGYPLKLAWHNQSINVISIQRDISMANKKLRVFKKRLRARLAMNRMKNMRRKGSVPKAIRNYIAPPPEIVKELKSTTLE